jgi:hypothetical protein
LRYKDLETPGSHITLARTEVGRNIPAITTASWMASITVIMNVLVVGGLLKTATLVLDVVEPIVG